MGRDYIKRLLKQSGQEVTSPKVIETEKLLKIDTF